jgi:hypothetical protein
MEHEDGNREGDGWRFGLKIIKASAMEPDPDDVKTLAVNTELTSRNARNIAASRFSGRYRN